MSSYFKFLVYFVQLKTEQRFGAKDSDGLQKQRDNDMFIYSVKPEDFGDMRLCIYRHFLLPVGFRMVWSLELRDSEPESFFLLLPILYSSYQDNPF